MESISFEQMNKKDLLFITARTPWPLITGDRIRCYNLLLQLSKKYKVTLVVLEETNEDNNLLDIVDDLISLKKKTRALKSAFSANFFSKIKYAAGGYLSPSRVTAPLRWKKI